MEQSKSVSKTDEEINRLYMESRIKGISKRRLTSLLGKFGARSIEALTEDQKKQLAREIASF